jgi:glycosyltransferase involved in cell wall biosynthesis
MTCRAAFVGPLPPPVNGFSNVCGMMRDLLVRRMPVEVFDRAPRMDRRLLTLLQQAVNPMRFLAHCIMRRNVVLYLALSGGRGQVIDFGYLLVGKLFRRPIFVHHHSFAYINSPSTLNRFVFALIRNDAHIVLSRKMGDSLTKIYRLDAAAVRVVSNAAFYSPAPGGEQDSKPDSEPLRIGYLSNITFDKGFVEFFDILARLKERGIAYRASIAGPLAPAARTTFDTLLREAGDVEYLGPIYGAEKERFYEQLDIFLFPTKYVNEAEPLVVYEAMRQGVHVIACDRGAIAEMLRNGAGLVFSNEKIVESAAEQIARFSEDRPALRSARLLSAQQAERIRTSGRSELESLAARMQGARRKTHRAAATFAAAAIFCTLIRSNTAGAAITDYRDALDLAVAAPDELALEQRTDFLTFFAANDILYDNNIYRVPSSLTDLSTLAGIGPNPSRQDYIDSITGGMGAEWLLGSRQSLDLNLRVDDNYYLHNTDLNNVSTNDHLGWNWGLGSALSGEVGGDYNRTLASFVNTAVYSRDVVIKTDYFASLRYQVGPRWRLFGGLLGLDYKLTAPELNYNNSSSKAVDLGADYLTIAANRIGFDYRYTDSHSPSTSIVNGVALNPDYREDRARLLAIYSLSEKTSIDGTVGYLKRGYYQTSSIGDFAGVIWRITLNWQPTPKTQLLASTWQQVTAEATAQTDYYVSKGVTVTPIWTASEKVALSLVLSRETQDYRGTNPASVNPVPNLTEPRQDTVTAESANITYTPVKALILSLNAGYQTRASNAEQFAYNDFRADLSVTYKFLRYGEAPP